MITSWCAGSTRRMSAAARLTPPPGGTRSLSGASAASSRRGSAASRASGDAQAAALTAGYRWKLWRTVITCGAWCMVPIRDASPLQKGDLSLVGTAGMGLIAHLHHTSKYTALEASTSCSRLPALLHSISSAYANLVCRMICIMY